MKKFIALSLLALGYQTASAQFITESFGSGANAFTMDFVTIDNPNNVADRNASNGDRYGSVAYTYNLGKYEVSRDMITKASEAGSLGITMYSMTSFGGNGVNRPATGVNWLEAAKYVNWMNTSTGGTAAYKFVGGNFQLWSVGDEGYNANNLFRNSLAKYAIASRDEWYKGAYGNRDGTWNNYATGSDTAPTAVAGGTEANTAVVGQSSPADITNAGGLSPYGTMAQAGNAYEWTESLIFTGANPPAHTALENREIWGGAFYFDASFTLGGPGGPHSPSNDNLFQTGFRVAIVGVPEPSALSLLAIGLGGLALVRRRKQS